MIEQGSRTFYISAQGSKVIDPGAVPRPVGKDRVDATFFDDGDTGDMALSQLALAQLFSDSFANAGISYCDVATAQNSIYQQEGFVLNWGDGNIQGDPMFVDAEHSDYRDDHNPMDAVLSAVIDS